MPYVLFDPDTRAITRALTRPYPGAHQLRDDDPAVIAYLEQHGVDPATVRNAKEELRRTDEAMARAIEDVITALLKKNLLKLVDLPLPVQERISKRTALRATIAEAYDRANGGRRP